MWSRTCYTIVWGHDASVEYCENAVPKSARWICNKTTAGVAQAQPNVGERAEPGCKIAAALRQCPRRGCMFKLIQFLVRFVHLIIYNEVIYIYIYHIYIYIYIYIYI